MGKANKSALQAKQLAKKKSKKNSNVSKKARQKKLRQKQKQKKKEHKKSKKNQKKQEVDLEAAEEFFGNNAAASAFASTDLNAKPSTKRKRASEAIAENRKRRKIQQEANSEDELSDLEDYERGFRKPSSWNAQKERKRLPIKLASGRVMDAPERDIVESESEEESEEQVKKQVDPKKRRKDIRLQIASLAEQLLAEPEARVPRLGHLVSFCHDKDKVVVQWAMLSLTEIFRSILPGYRINTKLLEQGGEHLTKQVKQVQRFESALLKHWSKFIFFLLKRVNRLRNRKNPKDKIELLSFSCVCTIFQYAHHFNLNKEILKTMVEFLNHKNDDLRTRWFTTFTDVLATNKMNTVMLEAVRELVKFIRKHDYKVRPTMVEVLIHLPLRNMDKPSKKKVNVKGKKQRDREKQLQLDMQESNAFADKNRIYVIHSEILEMVFEVTFTILKMGELEDPLLPKALRILTRHSRLVNLEIVLDMVKSLSDLIERLPFESFLQATLCTFHMLQGRGRAIEFDLQNFFMVMYNRMWEVMLEPEHGRLFLEVMNAMMALKSLSKPRVAAYIKRILSLCTHVHTDIAKELLEIVFRLFSRHHSWFDSFLENESEGGAVFSMEEEVPDASNAKDSVGWELPLLQTNYFKQTAVNAAQLVEATGPLQPMLLDAKQLFKPYLLKQKKAKSKLNVSVESQFEKTTPLPNFDAQLAVLHDKLASDLRSQVVEAVARASEE